MRVIFHQIENISTHRKIGHSDSITNEEMPKMKVGEFFKLYNIALGLKFKNSKFIFYA
jgi:hypothetical protein